MSLFSTEIYKAHLRGATVIALAAKFSTSDEWISERIEIGRKQFERDVEANIRDDSVRNTLQKHKPALS